MNKKKVKNVKNLIKKELLEHDEWELKTIDCLSNNKNIKLIELSQENVRKVEYMLRYNPDYPQFKIKKAIKEAKEKEFVEKMENEFNNQKDRKKPEFKYSSIEYILWFMFVSKEKKLSKEVNKDLYKYFINAILQKISFENHTHTSLESLKEIANRICNRFDSDKLMECLKEPYEKENYFECDYELIKCISEETSGKHNFSLATKFCHYFNLCIYLETGYVNLFSIYDKIVKENLHYYYNYYVIEEKNNVGKPLNRKYKYNSNELKKLKENEVIKILVDIYREYQTIIDEIIYKTGISRNGFDHLIWYNCKK